MILKAQIKLTIFYSAIFLLLFWSLSFGIYAWMDQFLGDSSRIRIIQLFQQDTEGQQLLRKEPPSDIVMDNLRRVLFTIDVMLLVLIPLITWFLTGNTLEPVKKTNKREQQFLSNASHELRTPLAILQAEMEVALKKKQTLTDYQNIIQSNKEEVEDLVSLIENLLFLSREQTKNSPISEQIDIIDLIAERIAFFQKKANQKQLLLTLHPPQEDIVISGNQQLLKRLFTNLLDNALKYTDKGSISVQIKQTKQSVIIDVKDTGIGIAKSNQEKIFDRFYRTDESRTEQGYGLGLSIAKQIVALHRGSLTIRSATGKGTVITVTIPLN